MQLPHSQQAGHQGSNMVAAQDLTTILIIARARGAVVARVLVPAACVRREGVRRTERCCRFRT